MTKITNNKTTSGLVGQVAALMAAYEQFCVKQKEMEQAVRVADDIKPFIDAVKQAEADEDAQYAIVNELRSKASFARRDLETRVGTMLYSDPLFKELMTQKNDVFQQLKELFNTLELFNGHLRVAKMAMYDMSHVRSEK